MNERTMTIAQIADLCQQADARELDLIWRILHAMLDRKGVQA